MNPIEKLSYRLFLEKIFYGIKDIIKIDNKIICISFDGISIWELFNKNLPEPVVVLFTPQSLTKHIPFFTL